MSEDKYYMFQTPVGWVALHGSSRGLRQLSLKTPPPQEAMDELGDVPKEAAMDADWFLPVQKCVERYLEGDSNALNEIELDLGHSPPFFRAAWEACRSIPSGETRSYAWLADQAGKPSGGTSGRAGYGQKPVAVNHTVPPCNSQ